MSGDDLSSLLIRRGTLDDVAGIVDLFRGDELHARPEGQGPASTLPYLEAFAEIDANPHELLLVAELEGRVVGTCQIALLRHLHYQGARIAQLEAVHVAGSLRGRGIGEQMMRYAMAYAKERGCLRIQLTSNKKRRDAHRFYERLGFVASHEGMKLYFS